MSEPPPSTSLFVPTRWTLVERSRGVSTEAKAALSELCEACYAPVVGFLRREGRDENAARELAHEFFAKVLASATLGEAERGRGRFRSYLLGAVKHFLANRRRGEAREKRGGNAEQIPLDDGGTETSPGVAIADPASESVDAAFDREWALALVERALTLLQTENTTAGQNAQFAALKPHLTPTGTVASHAGLAQQLGMSEGAIKVAIHRLRRRFREIVRAEIAQTLNNPADLDDEMRHLIAALSFAAGSRS